MTDGPAIKKPRVSPQISTEFDLHALENLLPDDLLGSDGDNATNEHENGLTNGLSESSTGYTDNSFSASSQNHGGSTVQKHTNLSQLLARTPHSQPLHGLPLDMPNNGNAAASPAISTPPPGPGGGGAGGQGTALMNPRASPAIQNSTALRQSPQLPRTATPGGHSNLQFTTNAPSTGPGNAGTPAAGLHLFQHNAASYNGNDVSFHGHPPQNAGRFPNSIPQPGQLTASMAAYGGQNGQQQQPQQQQVSMNGPSPMMQNGMQHMAGSLPRTSSAGNLAGQQQTMMANAAAGARMGNPNQPQMRMPNNNSAQQRLSMGPRLPGLSNGPAMVNGPMANQIANGQQGGVRQFLPLNSFSPPPSINLNPVSPNMPSMQQPHQQVGINMMQPGSGQQQQPMSVGGPVQNQLSPPNVGDPEKRKIIQQQLVLLLHAHKCQRREQITSDGVKRECTLPHCRTMKNVLTHMTQCTAGKACQMPHCASSRQIIQHWKTCTRSDCPVCLPLKQASDRSRPTVFDFPGAPQMQMNQSGLPPGGAPAINSGQPFSFGNGAGPRPIAGQPNFPTLTNGPVGIGQQNSRNEGINSNNPGIASYHQNQNAPSNQLTQYENVMSPPALGQAEGNGPLTLPATLRGLMAPPSDTSPLSAIQFSPANVPVKDWHQSINMDLRNHLIHKLVQAIFPYKDPSALQDKRMYNLISYARKVEADMYESANTREEYYQFLAEKIYKIQKELEEKRLKRQNDRKPTPNGMPGPPDMGGLQSLTGLGGAGSRGPNMPTAMRPMRPAGPGDFMVQSIQQQHPGGDLNGFIQKQSGSMSFPGQPQLPSSANGSFQNSNGGLMSGYGTPQHQNPYDTFLLPKSEPSQDFRSHSAMSGMAGNEGNSQSSQEHNGMSTYEIKQEESEGGSSPKHQLPSDHQNSIKSDPGNEVAGREGVPTHTGGSSPSQALPAPASVQSSTTDSETIRSEQDSAAAEATAEVKVVLTGKDGKNPKMVHDPEQLKTALMPLLNRLYQLDPEGHPFREPVDPHALGIPDYFDIVKVPMDLSTIRRKLDQGMYEDPWQMIDDTWIMFSNAWAYNRKGSRVYKYSSKLAEVFEGDIDPVMQRLGYCCGRRYVFQPQVLCCYGKQLCTIPRDTGYWSYQNRYTYCQRCFSEIPGDTVSLGDDPSQPSTNIRKELFTEMKNDQVDYEPFVNCKLCGRKNHQICVLHMDPIWPEGFVCQCCLHEQNARRKDNRFSAKKLPTTKLGQHIENHINGYLQTKHITEAGEVTIRVLSSCDKTVEIKPGMKHKFGATKEIAETFPYRTKAIFAFEDIDGTDVCFFGMHVQEYGSDCPPPNSRRVYIAYLDSVHFFRPKHVRTAVYHEILLSYINYCKNLGYTMAHIWACPPSEGDDYVFHCHPPEQKIPKPKRLQEWYRRMLDKGITDGIITEYKDILKHSMEDSVSCATELPYFEGDFWPNVMEECIKEVEQLELKEKEERQSLEDSEDSDDTGSEAGKGKKRPKKAQQSNKKQNKASSKGSAARKTSKKGLGGITANANILTQKIFNTMDKHKDVFFVVRLHPQQRQTSLPEIVDPDPLISCELMDGRDAFLTMSREKHYEFSSLRRTKFSTLAMLYELHTQQGNDRFVYTCNACKAHVETRYQCSICDDYDLCVPCYEKEGHPHKMDRLGMDLDDVGGPKDPKAQSANPKETRHLYLQKFIQSLVHTSQCRDANCRLTSCAKMKRFISHTKSCKKKMNGGCAVCKQLIALCCYHAKQCTETKCVVPFCNNIKQKIRMQRQQQELQRQHFNRRRNALMTQQIRLGPGQPPGSSQLSQSSVPSPGSQSNTMSPHTPGLGMKSQPLSAGVLDAVRVAQDHARQQATLAAGGKGGPQSFGSAQGQAFGGGGGKNINMSGGHSHALGMQSAMGGKGMSDGFNKSGMPGQSPSLTNQALPPLNQRWEAGMSPQNVMVMGPRGSATAPLANMLGQGNPSMQQQPAGQPPNMRPNSGGNNAHADLLAALKMPQSPEQQLIVSSILRANPQLMAMFIKNQRSGQLNGIRMEGDGGPATVRPGMPPQGGIMQLQQQPGNAQVQFNRMPHPTMQQQQGNQAGQQRPSLMYQQQNVPQNAQQQQQFMQQQQSPQMMGQIPQQRVQGQTFLSNPGMGGGGVAFSQAGAQQAGIRARFSQAQVQQQQQQPQQQFSLQNMGMGPPSSFNPHAQQQMTPQQSNDMNFALQQQQQQQQQQQRLGGPIRSPASALPVRSPQAQASPSLQQQQAVGRQSTPGPVPSASPRPLSGNAMTTGGGALHPSAGYGDTDMMGGGHGGGSSHNLMHVSSNSHMGPGGGGGGGGGGGQMDALSAHQLNMGPMGMNMPGHYGQHHQQPTSLTPQDHLNKFVDNL